MKELINLRRPREKHFYEVDGTCKALMYDEDVHYLKNGSYCEINNTLVEKGGAYENKENKFKVRFPKLDDRVLYRIEEENYYIEFAHVKPKTERFFMETNKNTLFMRNLTEQLDAKYTIIGSKLKESLILKEYTDEDIAFSMKTDAELRLENGRVLGKIDDKMVFQFEVPFMVSADGKYSDDVEYELVKQENEYLLTMKLDHEWLKEQKYPVVIDPTVSGNASTGVYDTFIYDGDSSVDRNSLNYLKIGVDEKNKIYRSLVKFGLPSIGTGSQIISASASFVTHTMDYVLVHPGYPSIEEREIIAVHEVTAPWTEETANWATMHDKYSNKIESYTQFFRCEKEMIGEQNYIPKVNSMDITNLVKRWYSGLPNNGIMVKFLNEVYNPNCKEYYMISKNNELPDENNPRPFLTVHYRNQTGLLGYMSYNSLEFKNGSSHINLYNGNVTNVFPINNTIAGKFPVSLEFVYSTNDAILNLYRNGWRFSLEEKLKLETIDKKEYISYLDSTSNLSYFYKVEEEPVEGEDKKIYYKDEDGQNLKITQEDNVYKLIDKEGNEKHFVLLNGEYVLSKSINVEKNEMTLAYDSSNRLIKVTDANGEELNIVYVDDSIVVRSSHKTTTITFIEGKVSKISTKQGDTTFEYNQNGIINKIKDVEGLGIKYDYYDNVPYRIKKIEEVGIQNTIGKSFAYTYAFNTTKITDEKEHDYTYTFNNQGNTIGTTIMDKSGLLKDSYGFNQRFIEAYGHNLNNKKISETPPMKFGDTVIGQHTFGNDSFLFAVSGGIVTGEESRTNGVSYKGQDSRTHNGVSMELSYLDIDESIHDITISGYVKNTKPVTVDVSYTNSIRSVPLDTVIVPASEEFARFSFTCIKPSIMVPIWLNFSSEADYYLADFQIDEGKIASPFNIVQNPDFSNESLPGWDFDEGAIDNKEVERVSLSKGENALKLNSRPDTTINATYPVQYAGKKGDVYNLSFWYKNEGVLENELEFSGNAVNLQFWSMDELEGAGTWNAKLNLHDSEWQFFSETFVAESDYSSFNLNILSMFEANSLYISNIMLIKEMGQLNFSYDAEGNIISMHDLAGNKNEMTYDSKNQLIGAFTPKGNRFSYEYDNTITSRVLKGISPSGISNEIEYDSFGNPVKTLINNTNPDGEIVDGKDYYIRLKGTKKYMDYNFSDKELVFKEDDCNHKTFKVKKVEIPEDGIYYRLEFLHRYLAVSGSNVLLQTYPSDSALFILSKKNNGSYFIIPKTKQSDNLAFANGKLGVIPANEEDYNQQFYLEDFGTDLRIETTATYTEDGKYIMSKTDALGKTVTYDIEPITGLMYSMTDAKGNVTNYTYNEKDQITSVTNNDKTISYAYNAQDQLSKINSGAKDYTFTYDDFLNSETVKINDNTLITNTYEEKNGNLLSSTYGTGDKVSYTYDDFDRLKTSTDSNDTYTYHYNSLGQLALVEGKNEVRHYYYDFANRLSEYVLEQTLEKFKENFQYDENGNVKSKNVFLVSIPGIISNQVEHNSQIKYEFNKDDSVVKVIFDEGTVNYSYDYLGRLENKNISGLCNVEYKYYSLGKKTSLLVKSMKIEEDLYEYAYDDLYNITDIYLNGELINHYEYDSLNELIQNDNYVQNITYAFTYDKEGNILSKKEYELGTSNLIRQDTFEYKNSSWEDQLTKFNDEEIIYDKIGNPIKIGEKTLEWENGRQLKSYTQKGITINYSYNKDGIRTSKSRSDGKACKYYLDGTDIILEKRAADMLYYIRDDVGSLIGMKYNEDVYYYIKNLQEDIIGIKDANFNLVATYEYDSWGKILSIKDSNGIEITDTKHIAHINPFRYRSYYYDEETSLYYLKSRYYNPVWGRFINIDTYLGVNKSILGYNLYLYVDNSPIKLSDSNGTFLKSIFKSICSKAKKILNTICSLVEFSSSVSIVIKETNVSMLGINVTSSTSYTTIPNSTKPIDVYSNAKIKKNGSIETVYGVNIGGKNVSVGIEGGESSTSLQARIRNTSVQFTYNLNEEDFLRSTYSLTISQANSFGMVSDLTIEVNQITFLVVSFVLVTNPVKSVSKGLEGIVNFVRSVRKAVFA